MKPLIPINPQIRKSQFLSACLALALLSAPHFSRAQCAAAPIAAAACSGGNGVVASNTNINSGNTYWYNGASATMSNINLGGGTLRICGTLTISSPNLNSGTLIVESGGNLTITSMPSMNGNITIINRGSLTISGTFTMQNSNNYIYNDLSTSNLTINGTVTMNGTSSYIINRGIMNFTGLYYQAEAAGICLQDYSVFTIANFTNVTTNSFTYSGTGSPVCLNVTSTATLQANVTANAQIHVCLGGSATTSGGATANTGGGWGSSVKTTGCSSCAQILSLAALTLNAIKEGARIRLEWTVDGSVSGNEVFYAERSDDGATFYAIATEPATVGQYKYILYDTSFSGSRQYYRIRAAISTGASSYSAIAVVETAITGKFLIYPNPVKPDAAITLVIPSPTAETARLSLVDMAGQVLRTKTAILVGGSNTLTWHLQDLTAGVYIVRVEFNAHGNLYGRIAVLGNY